MAIGLNMKADEVSEYHKEYLKLINRDNLNQVYEELKDDGIQHFLSLYKSAKAVGMGIQQVNRLLAFFRHL